MSASSNNQEQLRVSMEALQAACRDMTPVGAKAIPPSPVRFNLLAQPLRSTPTCRICKYPGHQTNDLNNANACRIAVMSTVGFWEDIAVHVAFLCGAHEDFATAIKAIEPTYEMRLDDSPLKGKSFVEIFVNRLTRNYLKFQAHFKGIRPKAMVFLSRDHYQRYEAVTLKLNEFLLKGQTCKSRPWPMSNFLCANASV